MFYNKTKQNIDYKYGQIKCRRSLIFLHRSSWVVEEEFKVQTADWLNRKYFSKNSPKIRLSVKD